MPRPPFLLGDCYVDPGLNLVADSTTSSHVQPRVMRVLMRLVESPGTTVSREDLLEAGWPDALYVSDEALTKAVSLLRRVMSDCSVDRNVIRTVPRRGYALMAKPEFDAAKVAAFRNGIAEANEPVAPRRTTAESSVTNRVPDRAVNSNASWRLTGWRLASSWIGVATLCAMAFVVGLETGTQTEKQRVVEELPVRIRMEGAALLPEMLALFSDDMEIVADSTWAPEGEPGKLRRRITMR